MACLMLRAILSLAITWSWHMRRFCFVFLLRSMWRLPAFRKITLPVPVTLKRFAMDFFVLFMGKRAAKKSTSGVDVKPFLGNL